MLGAGRPNGAGWRRRPGDPAPGSIGHYLFLQANVEQMAAIMVWREPTTQPRDFYFMEISQKPIGTTGQYSR
jgi:hypothetical protein